MAKFKIEINGGSTGEINFNVLVEGDTSYYKEEDGQIIVQATRNLVEKLHLVPIKKTLTCQGTTFPNSV